MNSPRIEKYMFIAGAAEGAPAPSLASFVFREAERQMKLWR